MRQAVVAVALAVLSCVTFTACGSSPSSQSSSPPAGSVPATLSIHDNPPTGVTILRFEIQVIDAKLQPAMGQPVSMLNGPQEVELEHLQTESALLANTMVPAGMYNGMSVTFANPQMTILNQGTTTLMAGGQSCPAMQVCTLTPTLNQMMVTIQVPTLPFPVNLTATSPLAFLLHFDVNASVQGDLSITPTVSLSQTSLNEGEEGEHEHTHLAGIVTAVNSPSFTLLTGANGQSSNITTDSNTKYDFDGSCMANNFSCIMVGQVLRVKVDIMSGGMTLATKVKLLELKGHPSVQGTVTSVNAAMNQFQFVVSDREDEDHGLDPVGMGITVTAQLSNTTMFSIDSDEITLPSNLTFANVMDVVVGQSVEISPQLPLMLTVTGTPPNVTITVNIASVRLEPSHITATVNAVNAGASPPNFTINMLPPLFTGAMPAITTIQVDVVTGTEFENISGIGALAPGQTVSVSGPLFNTMTQPTLVAQQVKQRGQQGED